MFALPKPPGGSALRLRMLARAAIQNHERAAKRAVIKRDGARTCRLVPGCSERRSFETAHLDAKGMGGDHGNRTSTATMLRACLFHHRGAYSLHSGYLKVECLTDRGADGPIAVYARGEGDSWLLVTREDR
jgi:hypothetical protein